MKRTYLVLIITLLVVGFATVATNLVINGTINIGFNKKDFNDGVVFSYAYIDAGTATIDEETEKELTFVTETLVNKDEQSILDYDIANKSEQYDANVELNCQLIDKNYKNIIKYENTVENTFRLEAGKTKSGKITITLLKPVIEDVTIEFECNIVATAQPRENRQEYVPLVHPYKEILLHGADPVLEATGVTTPTNKKLIPVIIGTDGKVTKANIKEKWYSYGNQWWANAVILNNAVTEPEVGAEIKETDIESYFVWIPKYRYKLWNVGTNDLEQNNPFAIEIEFNLKDTEDNVINPEYKECAAPLNSERTQALSGQKGKCENGMWMTHPAFITMGVNGFWVGKFQVGYKQSDDFSKLSSWTKTGAEYNTLDSTKVIVKPNVYSWRKITQRNMFYSLKEYATNLDSHMMKNTEWGAVAYLSHSQYGINKEVAQNTELNYKTGYAKTDSNMVSYPNQEGFTASTTGNISGVYDMSGGAWENMAAYRDIQSSSEKIGKSDFTKQNIINIGEKYFDVYDKASTITSYEKRILGDATGEMGPFSNDKGSWYQDYAYFVESANPWFNRGGHCNDVSGGAGQFYFSRVNGNMFDGHSSRLVLSPK